jgi:hypothetical protein
MVHLLRMHLKLRVMLYGKPLVKAMILEIWMKQTAVWTLWREL